MSSEKKVCTACDHELHQTLFKTQEKSSTEEGILSDFVFVYTGEGNVPKNVVLVHFDSSVVRIRNKSFSNCKQLKEVVLNEGLKSIGRSAFAGCNSLQSVTLPTTLTEIGTSAFIDCNELKEVVLNEGLRSIGSSAFYNCRSLEIISFPSTLNTVSRNAFIKCESLKRITLAYISKRLESIVQAGHVEVLSQIDSIPMRGSVEKQGNKMFIPALAIKNTKNGWTKPDCLDQVEQLIAYYEMKEGLALFELAVWKVKIDQAGNSVNRDACRVGVPKLVKDSILQYLFNAETSVFVPLEKTFTYTGDGCVPKNVVVVQVHSSVVDIRKSEFERCRYLRVIVLNEGLKKIGTQAFTGCCSLQSISFPSTLTEVDESAFNSCISLREVVLNDGLERIGEGVFSLCRSLLSVSLPTTVVDIGESTFSNCKELKEVVLNEGLRSIGGSAFFNCRSLESISFPSTLNTVSKKAFKRCTSLREVVLNEGLEKIGKGAFSGCYSLLNMAFPSTVIEIGSSAFNSCTSLREVVLNDGLRSIDRSAFFNCRSLERISSSPSTLNKVGMQAFSRCKSLKRITLPYISKRLESIVQAGYIECMSKIDEIMGIDEIRGIVKRQGSEMFLSASAIQSIGGDHQGQKKKNETIKALLRIDELITFFEMKEGLTLLELAVWKANKDQASDSANHDGCRIVLTGLVRNCILQYLIEKRVLRRERKALRKERKGYNRT